VWVPAMENEGLYEGDMVLSPDQMQEVEEGKFSFASTSNKNRLWPNAVVPYVIAESLSDKTEFLSELKYAIGNYHKYTCLRFKKRTNETAFIYFHNGIGCYSRVGYSGGQNSISLGRACWWRSLIMHEIAHSLGFHHEQSRPDRDQYVEILYKNIKSGMGRNFVKQSPESTNSMGTPYDYQSMMHYHWDAFGSGRMTIRTKDPSQQYEIGNGIGDWGFSPIDIIQFNRLYSCKGTYPKLPPYTPPSKDCYDLKGCAKLKFKKKCFLKPYLRYVKENCRKQCGLCTVDGTKPTEGPRSTDRSTTRQPIRSTTSQPTRPKPTSDGTCRDRVIDCSSLGLKRCNDSRASWRRHMQRSCRKYCGFC